MRAILLGAVLAQAAACTQSSGSTPGLDSGGQDIGTTGLAAMTNTTGSQAASPGTSGGSHGETHEPSETTLPSGLGTSPAECSQGRAMTVPRFRFSLERWCEFLREGGRDCPADRLALLETIGEQCREGHSRQMRRNCGVDTISGPGTWDANMLWEFDSESGRLLGATVESVFGPCGLAAYSIGPKTAPCETYDTLCDLCASGPERDAECPPEVLEVLPSHPCPAPPGEPNCEQQCDELLERASWPLRIGMTCDLHAECGLCSNGSCGAICLCMQDGVSRWSGSCAR